MAIEVSRQKSIMLPLRSPARNVREIELAR
jgi:hypothetical protein